MKQHILIEKRRERKGQCKYLERNDMIVMTVGSWNSRGRIQGLEYPRLVLEKDSW
jgi:hypothetical protein